MVLQVIPKMSTFPYENLITIFKMKSLKMKKRNFIKRKKGKKKILSSGKNRISN